MTRPRGAIVLTSLICLLAVGCSPGTSASGEAGATATPVPTPPNRVVAICDAAAPTLDRLDDQLVTVVTQVNLVDQGTLIAMVTGILAADVERLRSSPSDGDSATTAPWFAEIDAARDAGVRAVRASASRDLAGFTEAAQQMTNHLDRSRELSSQLGYSSCPY